MMTGKITYGMVGGALSAFIGQVHRKAIALDPRAQVVAGCFTQRAEANRATGEFLGLDADRVYDDFATMAEREAARPDGIDAVCITTPNNTHYAIAKAFLEHGIHVVCEKPLCFTVAEAEELVHLARTKDLVFAVTYTYAGYVMAKVMKEMIAAGKIGRIVAVNAEYAQDWLLDDLSDDPSASLDLSVWRKDPAIAGAANCVGDIGTHIEYLVHYLTGLTITRLLATTNHYGKPLDLNANMIVEYDNGANGAYWCSQIAAGNLNGLRVRIYGDQGSLEWEQHYPDYVRYTPKGAPTQTLSRGCGYITEKAGALSQLPAGHPEGLIIAFANIYSSVTTTLLKRRAGEVPDQADLDFPQVEDGASGVRFVSAVVQSAAQGSIWVATG